LNLEKIDADLKRLQTSNITYEAALQRLASFHPDDIEAKAFMFESELIPTNNKKIKKYALEIFEPQRDLYEAAVAFMERIYKEFEFVSGFSDVTTPVETIFAAKKGVCQDFAQFAIAALRSIGLCAKYMSGYIETLPPEGEAKLFGVDASHAWFALYIPGAGWLELDPTNNLIPREQHILLGSGRDYYDIAPLKGVVMSSGGSGLSVIVDVRREEEVAQLQTTQTQTQSQSQSQM
jgi:transglutaminase-like putative cysteine protease